MIKSLKILVIAFISSITGLTTAFGQAQVTDNKNIEFAADKVIYDQEKNTITANGNVILNQNGNSLNADTVIYDANTGEVKAEGGITINEASGNILYTEDAVLNGDLKNGFINNTRVIFTDGSKLIARSGG